MSKQLGFFDKTRLVIASKIAPVSKIRVAFFDQVELRLSPTFISQGDIPVLDCPEVSEDYTISDTLVLRIFGIEIKAPTQDAVLIDTALSNIEIIKHLLLTGISFEQIDSIAITVDNEQTVSMLNLIALVNLGYVLLNEVSIDSYELNFGKVNISHRKVELDYPDIEDISEWLAGHIPYPLIEVFPLDIKVPQRDGKKYQQDITEEGALFVPKEACRHGKNPDLCQICSHSTNKGRNKPRRVLNIFDLILPILKPPLEASLDSPVDFPYQLYGFQREGVKFLFEHERALLGDEMGLGKSIQAITAARLLVRQGKVKKILILCPKAVLTDWEKKWWDWAPEIQVIRIAGNPSQRQINWHSPAHVYLVTYETMKQDFTNVVNNHFDLIILDEIQKIKNANSKISTYTRRINADRRWGLSGTPLENRLDDVVSIFQYLKPGLIHPSDAVSSSRIQELIKPYILRRTKADALPDLPDKVYESVWLDLYPSQRKAYDLVEEEGIVELNAKGDQATVQHVFALINKLKQICNQDIVSGDSCKLDYLKEQLEQIKDQGDKALVFSQYPQVTLKQMAPKLKDYSPLIYDGSLSSTQQNRMVEQFNNQEENQVMLMSVKAGGVGITLTRANYVFHYDLWWNPAIAAQAEDRAHRIGQQKTVFVTYLYTRDTIEERIQAILDSKRQLFKEVFDDVTDTNLTSTLTESELFGLFGITRNKERQPHNDIQKIPDSIDSLDSLSPTEFEELVASVYTRMGYHTRMTPATRDHGVDIYAKRQTETGMDYLAIQCKHYRNTLVGVEHARSLYGVMSAEPGITRGVLVTSGDFSPDCKNFAQGKRIELINGSYLLGLIAKYYG